MDQSVQIAFSTTWTGWGKARPDNIPNKDLVPGIIVEPLTRVPTHSVPSSFGEHNNAQLRAFLDAFGSSTNSCRRRSATIGTLRRALRQGSSNPMRDGHHVHSCARSRAQTYSPSSSARTGRVLQGADRRA